MKQHNRDVRPTAWLALAGVWVVLVGLAGCRSSAKSSFPRDQLQPTVDPLIFPGLSVPEPMKSVEAVVAPPTDWRIEPLKVSDRHNHQVWISPSGNTAYGVIRFTMPLPVGSDTALRLGFLPAMKKAEGEAELISSERDPELPGTRFVAAGGKYLLRANLITRGWRGWAIYAGTLKDKEIVPEELALAELARDHTVAGLPD